MMLGLDELLCELTRDDEVNEQGLGLPPGFRFHPTDEELITFYLASKVFHATLSGLHHIAEVDLNRCEPWELPDVAKMGEREWYFFSLRDRKYPTGLRTNRATVAGYWKATGKDRHVYSAFTGALLGMKKTLVFYKGRAPRGHKTMWVMHEYRLDGDFSYRHTCKEEWVICRIIHKNGEKKSGIHLQDGGIEAASSPTNYMSTFLPQLLETQPLRESETLVDQFQIHHHRHEVQYYDDELKTLILKPIMNKNQSHYLFSMNELQTTTIEKQCKIESNNFSNSQFEIPREVNWMGKIGQSPNPNLVFDNSNGSCLLGFSSAADATIVSDVMSTSSGDHDRVGFQMMVDQSWPYRT